MNEDAKTSAFIFLLKEKDFRRDYEEICFGKNKCFYPVFKREKDCTFGIVCATCQLTCTLR